MVHQTDSYSADICDSQWHSTMAVSCCAMYRSKWNLTPLAHFVFHLLWDNYIKWLGCINMTLIWYDCVQWDDEQLCPFWSHALVLWLWSCSDTSCIQICHTSECFLNGFGVTSCDHVSFLFRSLGKLQPLHKRKERMHALGRTAGSRCLVPCLGYKLHNLVPIVWHRQMNSIQMCLELYAK